LTIQELGSLGEFVAAIATLVTLAYLAFQIRQNTRVARAQLSKDLFLTSRSALFEIAANEDLARIAARTSRVAGAKIDPADIEAVRQAEFLNSFFRLYELHFNLSRQGLLEESIAESYEKVIRMFARTGAFAEWWEQARQEEYHGAFAAHVDSILAQARNAV
jgi:hypothetical protein